jgi:hypothetical protein
VDNARVRGFGKGIDIEIGKTGLNISAHVQNECFFYRVVERSAITRKFLMLWGKYRFNRLDKSWRQTNFEFQTISFGLKIGSSSDWVKYLDASRSAYRKNSF